MKRLGVSKGNGRGQANTPRPHVSTGEMRNSKKIEEGQTTQSGVQAMDGGKRGSEQAKGGAQRVKGDTKQRVSSNSGASRRRQEGEETGCRT